MPATWSIAGFTTPELLAARGGSAGGLLMGAVVNQAPELFAAVVAEVPFVDCLTTMLDDSLPLTVGEWEEWGNPVADAEAYAVMKAYSPYDNVGGPAVAATPRTAARRPGHRRPQRPSGRATGSPPSGWPSSGGRPGDQVLLRDRARAGHGGPSGRYDAWRDEALVSPFSSTRSAWRRDPADRRGPSLTGQGATVPAVVLGEEGPTAVVGVEVAGWKVISKGDPSVRASPPARRRGRR